MCNRSNGDQRNVLTHKAVLLLSANRELNLKKRKDLIRPDLNKQYASLCNPSTAVSTFLFGDDLNKEVEELTKSHKVSSKVTPRKRMEPYKVPAARGVRGRGRFNQNAGRGRASSNPFFRFRPGTSSAPADSQGLDNQNPVGSPTISNFAYCYGWHFGKTMKTMRLLFAVRNCEITFGSSRIVSANYR